MILNLFVQLIFSLGLLLLAGQVLLKTSLKLSKLLGLSALFIGTVIMGFATSLPELSVSVQAALAGSSEITLGNVLGSNIANSLLILGLSSLIRPIPANSCDKKSAYWNMLAHCLLIAYFVFFKILALFQGALLLLTFALYMNFLQYSTPKSQIDLSKNSQGSSNYRELFYQFAILLLSLGLLIYSSDLLVHGAIKIAKELGVSEKVIAVTIVAVGTSLPEIVMGLMAAWHQKPELVFSTVLGSNIFNILFIVGITSLLCPIKIPDALYADLLFATCCSIFLITGIGLRREVGLFMLSIYASYIMLITI